MAKKETVLSVLQEIRDMMKKALTNQVIIPAYPRKINDRFMDNGDGTITDNLLKVIWVKDPSKVPGLENTMKFDAAEKACAGLKYAGKDGWRLPTVEELRSIVDYSRYNPAWDTNVFGGKFDDWYWTSTLCAWDSGAAWCVDSQNGFVGITTKLYTKYVRPVRSSQ